MRCVALRCVALVGAGALTPVYAACTPGATCEADGTVETPAANSSFQSVGNTLNGAALYAHDGGSITGAGLTITGNNPGQTGLYVETGSTVTLTGNSTIAATSNGLFMDGQGQHSEFSMTGGSITSADRAVGILNDTAVFLTDVDVKSSTADWAVYVFHSGHNTFSMTGGTLTSDGMGVDVSGDDNHLLLSGVSMTSRLGGAIGFGGNARDDSTLTINGGTTIDHTGSFSAIALGRGVSTIDGMALQVTATGSGNAGISIGNDLSGLSVLDAKNFSIQTSGNSNYHGIRLSRNSQVTLHTGSVTTQEQSSRGIAVAGDDIYAATLDADDVTITTHGAGAHGVEVLGGTATFKDSRITVNGDNAMGVNADAVTLGRNVTVAMTGGSIISEGTGSFAAVSRGAQLNMDGVVVSSANVDTLGVIAWQGGSLTFDNGSVQTAGYGASARSGSTLAIGNSTVNSTGNARYGLQVSGGSTATVTQGSQVNASGTGSVGLLFQGSTANTVDVASSSVSATGTGSVAVLAAGTAALNVTGNSSIAGDALASAEACPASVCGVLTAARLTVNANQSQLSGHTLVDTPSGAASRLTMNLANDTAWTLRPSAGGVAKSDVTFLNVNDSRIVFDPASAQRQTLVVGTGDLGGGSNVYNALGNASIAMNARLDAGGALANQSTDRLVINGDASGTTLLTVNAVAGSPGALTGSTASDGISLVQVYGSAASNSFELAGGYVPVGAYEYRLHAFDPGQSDASQRDPNGKSAPFWDFRLLSGSGGSGKTLLAQIPNYLVAPNALFQAQLLDVATLHGRLGANLPAENGKRDFFLHTYGGDYGYRSNHRSNRNANPNGFDADTRYHAVQGGGNFYGVNAANSSVRVGVAASSGDLSFGPQRVAGSHKTRMDVWSVAPTVTWQQAGGTYVDALASAGHFKGEVANRNGIGTPLEGKSQVVSVETGTAMAVADVTIAPQVQVAYQRLKFDRVRDADRLAVELGKQSQWTLRAGGKVSKTFTTQAGGSVQVYGTAHVAHTLGDGKTVRLDERFRIGKSGTVLQTGAGVAAAFAKDRATVHAVATRQTRIGRAGHQGWSVSVGARVRF